VETFVSRSFLRRASLPARLAFVVLLGMVILTARARASERWATLEAIHQLENPRDSSAPGQYGELGPYQFEEQVWRRYTRAPFAQALDRRASDAVAVKHYDWIKGQLERLGLPVSPYMIALVWNGGMGAVLGENPPAAALDYAARAANIAAELQRREVAFAR
jgi:hypothetical protein